MNEWTYSTYRATLRLNDQPFAIVTPDGRNALTPDQVTLLINDLCQTKLVMLRNGVKAVLLLLENVVAESQSPTQKHKLRVIIKRLKLHLRPSESTSPGSASTLGSGSSTTKPSRSSSRAASTRRRVKPAKRS